MGFGAYLTGVDSITGVSRNIARLDDVLSQVSKPPVPVMTADGASPSPPVPQPLEGLRKAFSALRSSERDVPDTKLTAVGAVAGAVFWSEHRVLGLVGGASLARNLPALVNGDTRKFAARNMMTTGGGVLGSLALPSRPVLGFAVGTLAGGGAAYYLGLR
jgi:hypothetical protein